MMVNISLPLPNDGYFFARCTTVGTTSEELEASVRGQISEERATQIARCAVAAMEQLKNSEPEGRC